MPTTENITVLFTDLVGSTKLASTLTPVGADEVRRVHFGALRQAVNATEGTEVKNLGDGLMIAFHATTPSLACAVAMQQAIERHNRTASIPLAIRIGISTGDVTVEDGDYFGDPVVEASRLCAVAQGGQILTTDIVRGLARRSGHNFVLERELDLKGLPEPVVAWEVAWEPTQEEVGTSRTPLPPRLPQSPAIGVVGRVREQEQLAEALKSVSAGEPGRIVLLSGEAGVGKSTLTSSVAHRAHAGGAVVMYGRCDEDLAIPYGPFVEMLRYFLAHVEDEVWDAVEDDHFSALGHLVPGIGAQRPQMDERRPSDPNGERWILYGAVLALIDVVARHSPVLIVLDDLHWADPPTLELLRYLASRLPDRVLIVGTYRDVALSAGHPLTETLAALVREERTTRIPLRGLADDEVIMFMAAAAGHDMDEDGVMLGHALYRETDGNPFFVAEVLRHLIETRAIVQDDSGRWVPTQELAEAGLPESVRQVLGSRVARLGREATLVLSAASVLGQEFEVDALAAMTTMDEEPILDVLDAAGSASIVLEVRDVPGRFRFAHALIQHTLYDDLGVTRRARLHRSAAEALEAQLGETAGTRAGEIARHWLASTRPAEASKATIYARLAGENALAALAPSEAVRWFTEALGVLAHTPDEVERPRCLAGLGEAQRLMGISDYRETLLEAAAGAQAIGDVETLVRAGLANNRGFVSGLGQVDHERLTVLGAALDAVGDGDSPTRARLLAMASSERLFDEGDYARRRDLADRALDISRRVGDPAATLDVLLRRAITLWTPSTVEELLAEMIEAEAIANRLNDPIGMFWARGFRAVFSIQVGDIADVVRCHDDALRLTSDIGLPILKWSLAFSRSWSVLLEGDIDSSESLADEALRLGTETGQPDAIAFYGVQLFALRWQQGRLSEIADFVSEVADANPALALYRASAAFVMSESGSAGGAEDRLRSEGSSQFVVPENYLVGPYLDLWARVASQVNEPDAARTLYDHLQRQSHLITFTGALVLGAVAHNLGTLARTLGRLENANEHFAHALELHRKIRAPFFTALTELEWGRTLLLGKGPREAGRAAAMLASARDTAERYGFRTVARRATEDLSTLA